MRLTLRQPRLWPSEVLQMKKLALEEFAQEGLEDYRQRKLELLESEVSQLRELLFRCESPLEQRLLLALIDTFVAEPRGGIDDLHLSGMLTFPDIDRFNITIRQQYKISVRGKEYRADFLVSLEHRDSSADDWTRLLQLVVEVDGHEFHERTKAQAQYDKSRDRAFTKQGFLVLRFTGSEVFRSPEIVAGEIESFLISRP